MMTEARCLHVANAGMVGDIVNGYSPTRRVIRLRAANGISRSDLRAAAQDKAGADGIAYRVRMPSFQLDQSEHDRLHRRYQRTSRISRVFRLLASKPRLVPYVATTASRGAVGALRADPTLGWLGSLAHVRRIQPDAILGAEWGGMPSFLAAAGPLAKPSDVGLDVGCGGGRVTRVIRPLVADLDAVDVSEAILDEARRGTQDVDHINFFTVDGFGNNLSANKYDLVVSHDVFVHFEFDQVAQYAFNVARAFKHDGVFVVSVYTLDTVDEIATWRAELIRGASLGARRVRRMPATTYEAIWGAAGFDVDHYVESELDEYAGEKAFTHRNYVLRRR